MKRKSITALFLVAALAVMMVLSQVACRDKNDDYDDPQPENGVDYQFDGEVTIPPDAVREVEGEWSQTFEIDESDGEHRFSIEEIIDEPNELEENE